MFRWDLISNYNTIFEHSLLTMVAMKYHINLFIWLFNIKEKKWIFLGFQVFKRKFWEICYDKT